MVYQVIVCPDEYCRGVSIIKETHDTVQCRKCDSSYKYEKYKVSFESDNREDAVEARTRLLININDDDFTYEELDEKGVVKDSEKIFSKRKDKDSRDPRIIIRDAFKQFNNPSKEDVITEATKSEKLDSDKATEVFDKMQMNGEIIDLGSHVKLL